MTDPSAPADPIANDDSSHVAPALAIWVLLQTVTLAICVARVPIWTGSAHGDQNAIAILLVVQVVASSLLVNTLMSSALAAACVILSAIPFVHLAGVLSATSGFVIVRAMTGTVAWLATLAIWASACQTALLGAVLSAVAPSIAIGGGVLIYLRADFAAPPNSSDVIFCGPVAAILALLRTAVKNDDLLHSALVLGVPLLAGTIARLAQNRVHSHQLIHN